MWVNLVGLLQVLLLAESSLVPDAQEEWDALESFALNDDNGESGAPMPRSKARSPVHPLRLPESVRIEASELHKELFVPEKGHRPVSELLKSILLPALPAETPDPVHGLGKAVEVLCHLDRMYVRVQKSLFSSPHAWKNLMLGTCSVNKFTSQHYYFLNYLKGCGIKRSETADRVTYTNTLHYKPPVTKPVVWELPFTIPVRCHYNRFHRSYRVGFLPKIVGGTFYRGLQSKAVASLAAMDESWKLLPVGDSFVLGKPVCFEVKAPGKDSDERLYINSCFVTSEPSPHSKEKYFVVENYGCLVDSKNSNLTRFHSAEDDSTVRLCFAAFLFNSMVAHPKHKETMFLHCELDLGRKTPSPSHKSCTFNPHTNTWSELSGTHRSVCECCESTCPAPHKHSEKITVSKSWELKPPRRTFADLLPEVLASTNKPEQDEMEFFWEAAD